MQDQSLIHYVLHAPLGVRHYFSIVCQRATLKYTGQAFDPPSFYLTLFKPQPGLSFKLLRV